MNVSIDIDIGRQELTLKAPDGALRRYPVSTAVNGAGERLESGCTPRGAHRIHAKIGAGCEPNTVFVGREPTGEVYSPSLASAHPGRDWILTRILWLTGAEPGFNQGGGVDTLGRYIYLHGTPDDVELGRPGSHGCIRMRNEDILELFERVECGTSVVIHE